MSKPIFVLHPFRALQAVIFASPLPSSWYFYVLVLPKKKIVESPGPNNFASETGTVALSLIFVHSAIVVIRAQQLHPHLSCHFSAAETGTIALSSTLARPCFGHCQHHTARDGTTRGLKKKKQPGSGPKDLTKESMVQIS